MRGASAPAGSPSAKAIAWDPRRIIQFIEGAITLAELEGIGKDEQYEMAATGHQYLVQGKLDEARTVFEGLTVLDPHDAYFHLALGSVLQKQEAFEEADWHYSRSIEINPYSCHAFANRGEVRLLLEQVVEGVQDMLHAMELDPRLLHESTKRARATVGLVVQELKDQGIEVNVVDEGTPSDDRTSAEPAIGTRTPPDVPARTPSAVGGVRTAAPRTPSATARAPGAASRPPSTTTRTPAAASRPPSTTTRTPVAASRPVATDRAPSTTTPRTAAGRPPSTTLPSQQPVSGPASGPVSAPTTPDGAATGPVSRRADRPADTDEGSEPR